MTCRIVPHPRVFLIAFFLAGPCAVAANRSSDTEAVGLLTSAVTALSGATVISDVTLTGSVSYVAGSDEDAGTVTLKAKGASESSLSVLLSSGPRMEIRQNQAGQWSGPDGQPHQISWHNCLTPGAWFFPQSLIAQASGPQLPG